jgi:hypothetical protein
MSDFDVEHENQAVEATLELHNSNTLNKNSHEELSKIDLQKIDTDILEGWAKQLSYGDIFHQETWKYNSFSKCSYMV